MPKTFQTKIQRSRAAKISSRRSPYDAWLDLNITYQSGNSDSSETLKERVAEGVKEDYRRQTDRHYK
jgi:hypothetical protein